MVTQFERSVTLTFHYFTFMFEPIIFGNYYRSASYIRQVLVYRVRMRVKVLNIQPCVYRIHILQFMKY